jgi:hypothetical protein
MQAAREYGLEPRGSIIGIPVQRTRETVDHSVTRPLIHPVPSAAHMIRDPVKEETASAL